MSDFDRNIYGLTPHTRYAIRVRAANGFGVYSDWSEALAVTTQGDNSIPSAPTNLILNFETENLVINWTSPTNNVDSSPFLDFSHYEITIINDLNPKTYRSSDNSFVYTFNQNQLDWIAPSPNLMVEVRTVDSSGNKSNSISGTAVNQPPLTPNAPIVIASFTLIVVVMPDAVNIKDLKKLELFHTTDLLDGFDLLATTTNDSYTHEVTQGGTHYYRYRAFDVFNQPSDYSPTASGIALIEGTNDTEPPEDWDTGLNGVVDVDDVTQVPFITLTWTAQGTALDLDHYEIRHSISGEGLFVTHFVNSDLNTLRVEDLINETDYDFQIRAVDFSGNPSSWLPNPIPLIKTTGAGNIKYDVTATGGIVVQGSGGFIRSGNYSPGVSGWRLNNQGLDINEGTISAPAIQIGVSSENLLINSSFENIPSTIATNWNNVGAGNTYSKETGGGNFLYQSASQKIVTAAVAEAGVSQTISISNGFLKEAIPANTWITVSYWIKQGTGTAKNAKVALIDNTNTATYQIATAVATSTAFQRVVHKAYVTSATSDLTFKAWVDNPSSGNTFYFEGAQLQLSSFVTSYAPATLEIPDNYIQSAYISTLVADKISSGSINSAQINVSSTGYIQSVNYVTGGSAVGYRLTNDRLVFQNGGIQIVGSAEGGVGALSLDATSLRAVYSGNTRFLVDATQVLLAGTVKVTNTAIESSNFSTGSAGWQIKNDGSAELNNVTVRGNIQGNSNTIIEGGTFRTGTSGARITITGNLAIDSGAPIMQIYGTGGGLVFNAHQLGIFFGGADSTNSPFYYDVVNARATFKNVSGTYAFSLNSEPSNDQNKVLKLTSGGQDKFFLKTDGSAYFSGQVVASLFSSTNFMAGGTNADYLRSSNFAPQTATTTISVDYTSGTTFTVVSTTGFSGTSGSKFTVGALIVTYTGKTSTTFTGCSYSSTVFSATFPSGIIGVGTFISNGLGWNVDDTGAAEFGSVTVRGSVKGSTVDGSIITGGLIRTAASGNRVALEYTNAAHVRFYTGNVDEVSAGFMESSTTGGSYPGIDIFTPFFTGATHFGGIFLSGGKSGSDTSAALHVFDHFVMIDGTGNTDRFRLDDSDFSFRGQVTFSKDDNSVNYVKINQNSNSLEVLNGPLQMGANAIIGSYAGSAPALAAQSGNIVTFNWTGTHVELYIDGGGAQCVWTPSGSKTFVINHPNDETKYLVHGAIEGPTNDVFYRDEATLKDGMAVVRLPDYFEALTRLENRTVQITPIFNGNTDRGELQVTRVSEGQFTVYGHGDKSFFWEVKAERKDIPKLEVEPSKDKFVRKGSGPYTWLEEKD